MQCTNTSASTCSGWAKLSPFLQLPHIWHNTYQFADLFLPVWGWSGSGSNHSGSLIVSEFLYASLSCHYVAHLKFPHRKIIKHSPTGFFWLMAFLSLMHYRISQNLAAQKTVCQHWNPFSPLTTFPHPQNIEFSMNLQNIKFSKSVLASSGRYVCFCSCPTCKHGRWG